MMNTETELIDSLSCDELCAFDKIKPAGKRLKSRIKDTMSDKACFCGMD